LPGISDITAAASVFAAVEAFYKCRSRGRVQEERTLFLEMTCGFLMQLVFCKKKKPMCFIVIP